MRKTAGFTLIELIVVVSVILVISVITILNYNSYSDRQRVKQAGLTLRSDLRLAQTKAASGQKPSMCDSTSTLESYDVTFTTCGGKPCYTIQPICMQGSVAVNTSAEIMQTTLPTGVSFSASYPPIRFFSVTGVTNFSVDRLLVLTGAGVTYTVSISPSGSISDY